MLTNYRFPSKGEKIPGRYFDEVSFFVIYDDLNIRAVFKEHLPAVSAGRHDSVKGLFVGGHNGIKFPLPGGNGYAHSDIFCARAVDAIAVDAGVHLAVFAQKGAAYCVVVDSVVKVFGKHIKTGGNQPLVSIVYFISFHKTSSLVDVYSG